MNWSHALLVVAMACYLGSLVAVESKSSKRTKAAIALFTIATISGALAAGLWR